MYIGFFLLILLLTGAVSRGLLYQTKLPGGVVLLLVLLISGAAAVLLYLAAIYFSVFAFQLNDPINW